MADLRIKLFEDFNKLNKALWQGKSSSNLTVESSKSEMVQGFSYLLTEVSKLLSNKAFAQFCTVYFKESQRKVVLIPIKVNRKLYILQVKKNMVAITLSLYCLSVSDQRVVRLSGVNTPNGGKVVSYRAEPYKSLHGYSELMTRIKLKATKA